ncbi:MAG: sugar acetyltransferase, partial [Alphaproteobacteria bacterium]|nr:sugar acetyltransferase [Alphaproteobacteria bacterium]
MIAKPVIVLGAGGHAKVLIAALRRLKAEVLGATDVDVARKGSSVLDVPIIGDDSVVLARSSETIFLVNGLGTTRSESIRRSLYER